MTKINTIDLWIEQYVNHYVCLNESFIDGFENEVDLLNSIK